MMRKGLISTCKLCFDGIAPSSLPYLENSINNNTGKKSFSVANQFLGLFFFHLWCEIKALINAHNGT